MILNADNSASYSPSELKKYLLEKKYNKLWDYFKKYEFHNLQHQYMADLKIEVMSSFLKSFDSYLTEDQRKSYIWYGLRETEAWDKLSSLEKEKYKRLYEETETKASKKCN